MHGCNAETDTHRDRKRNRIESKNILGKTKERCKAKEQKGEQKKRSKAKRREDKEGHDQEGHDQGRTLPYITSRLGENTGTTKTETEVR